MGSDQRLDASPDVSLDTSRIDYLFDASVLARRKVLVVGLGSGGAVVVERLAMCGFSNWSLFDPDVLEPVNLVKHPARRADLGRSKVDITAEWLLDRNPGCSVEVFAADVVESAEFEAQVASADVVICAVDNAVARNFVNSVCVRNRVPAVFGMVFRTGLGGEVYAYLPGETGCHACKLMYCMEQGLDLDNLLELTEEESQRIYGLGEADFAASGLAADISVVASYHAHYVVSLFGGPHSKYLTAPSFNWLTLGMRRVAGVFDSLYETRRVRLRPLAGCHLACGAQGSDQDG